MKKIYKHEYGGDGVCARCSADSWSSSYGDPCPVPPGHTIYDNPSNPRAFGKIHPIGSRIPRDGKDHIDPEVIKKAMRQP